MMKRLVLTVAAISVLITAHNSSLAAELLLNLGPEQFVHADDADIQVGAHSVPSYVDLNNDNLEDLLIGEKIGTEGKVRIYLNSGTPSVPLFTDYFYAQSAGIDLACPASESFGCIPRAVNWDAGSRKDLLIGTAEGTVKVFLNIGFENDPVFDGGSTIQVGYPNYNNQDIDVGQLAAPTVLDWDNDGKNDIVAGANDGRIHIYLNCGCSSSKPAFYHSPPEGEFAEEDGTDLTVPQYASTPVIRDLDGDGKKDILTGNAAGQILFYQNVGTDLAPTFSGFSTIEANGIPIELGSETWSAPFVCDWTGDGCLDILIGAKDGKVRLYQGRAQPTDLDGDYDFDGKDFAVLSAAWRAQPAQPNWNPFCDISEPSDEIIDELDLAVFCKKWLTLPQYPLE